MTLRRSDDPLDTYLLRVFVLLISERSVSRTALRMNQSQPAVSAALKRLREILGDRSTYQELAARGPAWSRRNHGNCPAAAALTHFL